MALTSLARPEAPREERVALLDLDPELARRLSPEEQARARRIVMTPLVRVPRGAFDPAGLLKRRHSPFAAVLTSGLVSREIAVGEQATLRLFGPGDILQPLALEVGLLTPDEAWVAVEPTTAAVLDDGFLRAVQYWPRLATAFAERLARQHDATLLQLGMAQQPRVEDRVTILFSALAERWGRVTGEGVVLPLTLTHEAIGRLVGARRPTVSLALKALRGDNRLFRRPDGSWLLPIPHGEIGRLQPLVGATAPRLLYPDSPARPPGGAEELRKLSAQLRGRNRSELLGDQQHGLDVRSEIPASCAQPGSAADA